MMTAHVSALSMVMIAVSAIIAIGLPIAIFIYCRKRGAAVAPFFVGCAVMFLFALVLESIVHNIVFGTAAGNAIQNSVVLYGLYGGLMAGLFEETGRFAAFKTVLKKHQSNDVNALMYGAGHGGLESIVLVGIAMITNLVLALMINSGTVAAMLQSLPAESAESVNQALAALTDSAPMTFLAGAVERVFAIALQISLSVLVWFAAKDQSRILLFPLAIGLHAAVDCIMYIVSQNVGSIWITEAVIGVMAVAVAMVAKAVWKKNREEWY